MTRVSLMRRPRAQCNSADPEVAPPGVLPTEAKDQMLDRGIERGTTGSARVASTPPAPEFSVPPRERVRADQEAPPPVPGEQPKSCCQKGPIGRGEARSRSSSTEDLQLVAKHG